MATFVRSISRFVSRLILPAMLLAVSPVPSSTPSNQPPQIHQSIAAVQHYYPEVRLRKLHLVRPDLIPYPIMYEVYC